MKVIALMFFLPLSFSSHASPAGEDFNDPAPPAPAEARQFITAAQSVTDPPCANEAKLRGICAAVSNQDQTAEETQKYPYRYTRKIFEASCVDMYNDPDEVIAQKVSAMWARNADRLTCTDTSFDVEKGSIIRYAVNAKFDKFIWDVVGWKIDLNKVDESDNRTVLDYVRDQIISYKGLSEQGTLESYYDHLRRAGAKHRDEQ